MVEPFQPKSPTVGRRGVCNEATGAQLTTPGPVKPSMKARPAPIEYLSHVDGSVAAVVGKLQPDTSAVAVVTRLSAF